MVCDPLAESKNEHVSAHPERDGRYNVPLVIFIILSEEQARSEMQSI